jgi:hypothetical protein
MSVILEIEDMGEKKESRSNASAPTIVETYRDYIPPQCVLTIVEDLLKTVPPDYIRGLQTIVLTNQAAKTRAQKQQKVWTRNRKIKLVESLGYYSPAWRSSRATITLHIDNILKDTRRGELVIPFVRYYPFASVLYHEIGHHIHAEHNPTHEGKENVAEDWSKKLLRRFYRTHYWFLLPLLDPLIHVIEVGRSSDRRRRSPSGKKHPDASTTAENK